MPRCCECSDGEVEARSGLGLDNGVPKGEEQGRDTGTAFSPVPCQQGRAAFPMHPVSHPQGLSTASSPSEKANAELSAYMGSWEKTYSSLAVKDRVWAFHPQMCFLWPSCATLCSTGLQSFFFSSVNSSISYMFTLGNAGKVSVCFKWNVTTVRSYWEKLSYHPARSVGRLFYNSIEKWDSNSHMLHPSHFKEVCI